MSCTIPQPVPADCRKYAKSLIEFNNLNTFNNVETRLNETLIKNICSIFPQPRAEIISAMGFKPSTFYDMKKKTDKITIEQILAISNGLHIPVRRLFSSGRETVIGQKEDYVVEPYAECSFNEKGIEEFIAGHRKATWKAASEAVNMTWQGLRESMLSGRRLPVARFLNICKRFGIDPFSIIIDPNPEQPKKPALRNATAGYPDGKAEIAALRKDVDALSKTVADLSSKYEELFQRYEDLLHRVQVNIDTISNSYVNTIGIAADDH